MLQTLYESMCLSSYYEYMYMYVPVPSLYRLWTLYFIACPFDLGQLIYVDLYESHNISDMSGVCYDFLLM